MKECLMDWDETDIYGDKYLTDSDFTGCCSARIVYSFPEDSSPNLENTLWDCLCELLDISSEGLATYITLSTKSQKQMIDLVEACPYVTQVDEFKSCHGDYNINLYRVQL